jgi:hypothetical protein
MRRKQLLGAAAALMRAAENCQGCGSECKKIFQKLQQLGQRHQVGLGGALNNYYLQRFTQHKNNCFAVR